MPCEFLGRKRAVRTKGLGMIRKLKYMLVASLLASSAFAFSAPPAYACMGEVCETINNVCNLYKGWDCVK